MHSNRVWNSCLLGVVLVCWLQVSSGFGEELIFEDKFEEKLSPKWDVAGLKKEDYRIVDGGLEMRVQPGEATNKTPVLRFVLPENAPETVIVSVKVTVLDDFSKDNEFAGVYLFDETGLEFGAKKQRVKGELVFAPPEYIFRGKPGEEGDVKKYVTKYVPESADAGALRIIVRANYAHFQIGPNEKDKDKYLNPFYSAINRSTKRGFCLIAAGAPDKAEHWVRFDDFRITP